MYSDGRADQIFKLTPSPEIVILNPCSNDNLINARNLVTECVIEPVNWQEHIYIHILCMHAKALLLNFPLFRVLELVII